MASVVDICNLALSHIGQDANISSIDPPEGSADAEHAVRFYRIAFGMVLQSHPWSFASKRIALALLADTQDPWLYAYALPSDCVKTRRVIPAVAGDDHNGVRFLREGSTIYTNEADARLVYTFEQTDPTTFTPGFVTALSWLLASYMAGPVLKDTTGQAQARAYQMYQREAGLAMTADANSDRNPPPYIPSAILARFGVTSTFDAPSGTPVA